MESDFRSDRGSGDAGAAGREKKGGRDLRPDIVLMDIGHCKGLSSFEAARHIRKTA